jgi:alkanesulfonate monooxygenase
VLVEGGEVATVVPGASTALVGTPETVAAAIVDYVDLGADLVSIRGYNTLADARDYGRYVFPLVRQELAHREATGQRGTLQADNPGAFAPGFDADALAREGATLSSGGGGADSRGG